MSEMNTIKNIYSKYSVADITIYLNETYPSNILDAVGLEKQEWYRNSEYILSICGNSYLNGERVISILWGIKSPPELNKINATNETWKKFTGNVGLIDRRLGDALGISSGDDVSIFLGDKVINITILDLVDMAWSVSFTRPITLYVATPLDFVMAVLSLDSEKYNTILLDVEYGYDVDEVANKTVELLEDKNISVSKYTALNVEALEQYVERFSVIFTLLMSPISIIAAMFIIIIFLLKVSNEARIIGIKRALGYTPSQIFLEVVSVGFLLYAISLPVGYLFDYAFTHAIASAVYREYTGISGVMVITVSFNGFIRASLICFLATLIAVLIPARKASRICVSDAIRYGMERPKVIVKGKKVYKHLFLGYAIRYLKSRRGRNTALILTIIIGFGFSMAIVGFMDALFVDAKTAESFYDADIMLSFKSPINKSYAITQISMMKEVKCVEALHSYQIDHEDLEVVGLKQEEELYDTFIPVTIIFCEPGTKMIRPLIIEGKMPLDLNDSLISYRLSLAYLIHLGDNIKIRDKKSGITLLLNIVGIGITQRSSGKTIITTIDMAYKLGILPNNEVQTLLIKAKENIKPEYLAKRIIDKFGGDIASIDILTYSRGIRDMVQTIQAFAMSILLLIFSVAFFSYIIVGIISTYERKYELSVLKSVGMTNTEILKILIIEAVLFYAISIIPIMIVSIALSKLLSKLFTITSGIEVYTPISTDNIIATAVFPLITLLIATMFMFVIVKRFKPSRIFTQII